MTEENTAAFHPLLGSDSSAPIVESLSIPKDLPLNNYASSSDLQAVEEAPLKGINNEDLKINAP